MEMLKNKYITFINSLYYPVFIALLVLIGHTFSLELFSAITLLTTVGLGLIFCCDLKFLVSPLFMFIFIFSQKSVEGGKFYSKPYIIAMISVGLALIGLFVFHFIYYRKSLDIKALSKSRLLIGILALSASFLLNGFLNFKNYSIQNITFAIIIVVSLALVFFIFQVNYKANEKSKDYLFFVLYLTSIVLTLELLLSFVHQIKLENGEILKESILLGWGMWNNIGGMLAFLLPSHFYFATTAKRFGYVFYFTGVLSYVATVLTLSRSSLLTASLIIAISIICSCCMGNNKKFNRIISLTLLCAGILFATVFFSKISAVLNDFLQRGFNDNGRFNIYRHGLESFLENPIFGNGFASDYKLEYEFVKFLPFRYHNTIIQIMAGCGSVGLISYLYHRYTTAKLLIEKKSLFSLFSGLCIVSLLLCSLLDNHFFNIYPLFIYSVILVVNEKATS